MLPYQKATQNNDVSEISLRIVYYLKEIEKYIMSLI